MLFEGLIALLIARRTYLLVHGVRYSLARLLTSPLLYGVLLALTVAESALALPWFWVPVDVVCVVLGTYISAVHAERTVVFTALPQAGLEYRLTWHVGAIYLGLWIARLALEIAYFPQLLSFSSPPTTIGASSAALLVLAVVEALFSLSSGMLIGRAIGVMRARNARGGAPAEPSSAGAGPAEKTA